MIAVDLHAVVARETSHGLPAGGDGARWVVNRELAAVVCDRPRFVVPEVTPGLVASHQALVDGCFAHGAVLPVPVGVVFRSEEILTRWMDLHYVALTDALTFVEDRVAGRVHVRRAAGDESSGEDVDRVAAVAASGFRGLRRGAVASVPLRTDWAGGRILSSAFLVERGRWSDLVERVAELSTAHPDLSITWSGPWAPYDFVQMQFGG